MTQQWQQAKKTWQLATMPHTKLLAIFVGGHLFTKETYERSCNLLAVLVCLGSRLLTGRGAGAEECTLPVDVSCRLIVTFTQKFAVIENAQGMALSRT